jgi:hypothetical protein
VRDGPWRAGRPIDDVYTATWRRAVEKNRAYFQRYPEDRERGRDILHRLDDEEVRLPSGDRPTARRFLQLGLKLGDSAGFELGVPHRTSRKLVHPTGK